MNKARALEDALKFADKQKHGSPGFWNDLRILAEAYRTEKSRREKTERELIAGAKESGGLLGEARIESGELREQIDRDEKVIEAARIAYDDYLLLMQKINSEGLMNRILTNEMIEASGQGGAKLNKALKAYDAERKAGR